jgi:hypothetical protein
MSAVLSAEINGCVSRIASQLSELGRAEQIAVLREVSDRLEDLRAKQVYDDVTAGKMDTLSSTEVMANLKAKHGF